MTDNFDKMISDVGWWHGQPPPFSPNQEEIIIYKQLIGSSCPVYLLGMTKALVDLCDVAVDLTPAPITKPILKTNWLEMNGFRAGVIIGDGVINLAGLELVDHVSKLTSKLICRVFLKKFEWMRYATHFPKEFPGCVVIPTQKDIAIVQWNFPNSSPN